MHAGSSSFTATSITLRSWSRSPQPWNAVRSGATVLKASSGKPSLPSQEEKRVQFVFPDRGSRNTT